MGAKNGLVFRPTHRARASTVDIDCGVRTTSYPAIKNAPLPADGPGSASFSNLLLILFLIGTPFWLTCKVNGGLKTFLFFSTWTTIPVLIVFWSVASFLAPRINDKAAYPGRPVEYYLMFKNESDRRKYWGKKKIPMTTFSEKYFDGDVEFNGDALDVLEYRHDWACWHFTWDLFVHIFTTFAPEVIMHSRSQDEEQIRDNYDRGDDFYAWFLGPRMIYTSGIISDITKEESLEQLQDNKLAIVCEKIGLKPGETLLDIGCGWGTLAKFASINYGARVTGITLGRNQTVWGNRGLRESGVPEEQSRILCMDYRDIPEGRWDKITCLEMAEHVGIRRITNFFRQCYEMLEDDGIMYVQVSGLRKAWQYEDLVWGLFMSKYIFPGADASTPLSNYVEFLEAAGFEIKNIDTVGVHYSATIWHWYRNWLKNADKVKAKYGARWYRIWEYFLATATIASRQGTAACFQITVVKNLNSTHRVEGTPSHFSLKGALEASRAAGRATFPESKRVNGY